MENSCFKTGSFLPRQSLASQEAEQGRIKPPPRAAGLLCWDRVKSKELCCGKTNMKVDESLELTGVISQPAGNERHRDCLKEMPTPEYRI